MARKKTDPEQDPFDELKKEITARIAAVGLDRLTAITGDRNYIQESDGTLWMQYGPVKRAINTWREVEWEYFTIDVGRRDLWRKLEETGK